jgi:hypothetical protein
MVFVTDEKYPYLALIGGKNGSLFLICFDRFVGEISEVFPGARQLPIMITCNVIG